MNKIAVKKDHFGAISIEYAFALPIFLMFLILCAEFAKLSFNSVSLQFAVSTGARWGILGETTNTVDENNNPITLNRVQSIQRMIKEEALKLGLHSQDDNINICLASQPNCVSDNAGGPNDTITISANLPVSLFLGYEYDLNASVITRNEPYA